MNTTTQKKELDIKPNEGMIFDNGDGTWSGGFKVDDEYFHVNMTARSDGGPEVMDLTGTSASDSIEANPPLERRAPGLGKNGKAMPEISGRVRTQNGNLEKEIAGWLREGRGKAFFSMRISDPR